MEKNSHSPNWCEQKALDRRRNRYLQPTKEMFPDLEFWNYVFMYLPCKETDDLLPYMREVHRKCKEAENLLVTARQQERAMQLQSDREKFHAFLRGVVSGILVVPGILKIVDSFMAIPLTVKTLEENIAILTHLEIAIRKEMRRREELKCKEQI